MAILADQQPERVRKRFRSRPALTGDAKQLRDFQVAQAAESATRLKARMVISGEEFDVREQVRGFREKIDEDVVLGADTETRLNEMITNLEALKEERGGRYAGRDDISKSLAEARKRLEEWRLKTERAGAGARARADARADEARN